MIENVVLTKGAVDLVTTRAEDGAMALGESLRIIRHLGETFRSNMMWMIGEEADLPVLRSAHESGSEPKFQFSQMVSEQPRYLHIVGFVPRKTK